MTLSLIMMRSDRYQSSTVVVANQTVQTAAAAAPPHTHTHTHTASSHMSPLTAILSLLVLVAIPALIYAFFFAINCPRIPFRRPHRQRGSVVSHHHELRSSSKEANKHAAEDVCSSGGVKYRKDEAADHEEEYGVECPVCLAGFAEGDYVRRLNDCKHSFHLACIDKWLSSHSNCPVCRAPVPTIRSTQRPKPAPPAPPRDDDFRQGLPDAASLV